MFACSADATGGEHMCEAGRYATGGGQREAGATGGKRCGRRAGKQKHGSAGGNRRCECADVRPCWEMERDASSTCRAASTASSSSSSPSSSSSSSSPITDHRSPITLNPHPNHLSGSVDSLTESEMKNPNGTSHTCGIGGAVEGGSTCVSKSVIRNLREHCLTTALST